MKISNLKLKSILVDPGHISEKDFNQAMNLSNEKNISIEDILLDRGLINDGQLGHIIAEFIGVPYVNLRKEKIDDMVLNLIPEIIAKSKKIIIFYQGIMWVLMRKHLRCLLNCRTIIWIWMKKIKLMLEWLNYY